MTILPCRDPALLARLVPLASAEGFGHLERLAAEWESGANRFEGVGEVLLVVESGGRVVACGGLTHQSEGLGRVRRVYVDPDSRCFGVGTSLIEALLERARASFDALVLYTDNQDAARLYERLGFAPEEPTSTPEHATHRLDLRGPGQRPVSATVARRARRCPTLTKSATRGLGRTSSRTARR